MPQTDDDQGSLMFRCCFHDLFGRLGATQWLVNLVVHSGVVELATDLLQLFPVGDRRVASPNFK